MKKKTLFVLCFLGLTTFIFSFDLAGTTWGPEKGGNGRLLVFTSEKDFIIVANGPGGGEEAQGAYSLKGNNLTLNIVSYVTWYSEMPNYIYLKTIQCTISEIKNLFAKYKITGSDGLELWSWSLSPNPGEKCILDNHAAIACRTSGKIKENTRVREGPGTHYRFYSFDLMIVTPIVDSYTGRIDMFDERYIEHHAIPKGYTVQVFGRSEHTTSIDDEEYPWYYVRFDKSNPEWCDWQFGWVWGGLIDFYDLIFHNGAWTPWSSLKNLEELEKKLNAK